MSIALAVGNILEVKFACLQFNQVSLNVTHWAVTATGGAPTLEAVSAAFDVAAAGAYITLMCADAQYYGSAWKRLAPTVDGPIFYNVNATAGTAGGNALPAQTSGIITLRTGLPGRANRGRIYPGFPSSNFQSALERPLDTWKTALIAWGTIMLAPFTFNDHAGNTAIISLGVSKKTGAGFHLVNAYEFRRVWATQRRRGDTGRLNPPPW